MFGLAIAVFAFATLATGFACVPGPVPPDCMMCICRVESRCRMPNPLCHEDPPGGSLSCGPYHIKDGYWVDGQQNEGDLDGDWKTCTASFICSERAVQGYMERYAIAERLGHTPSCEDFARIHHGGPNGINESGTLAYWTLVKACLDKK